ncbi:MAG: hypothetical protein F4Y71_03035 [Acidobacteria bacterium]|nr:hypothetical protein [Acidobacteriota bacterium]
MGQREFPLIRALLLRIPQDEMVAVIRDDVVADIEVRCDAVRAFDRRAGRIECVGADTDPSSSRSASVTT